MLKRKNDRQPQSMEELYPDDYWLDEEDGEELPVPEMKRKPVSGRNAKEVSADRTGN